MGPFDPTSSRYLADVGAALLADLLAHFDDVGLDRPGRSQDYPDGNCYMTAGAVAHDGELAVIQVGEVRLGAPLSSPTGEVRPGVAGFTVSADFTAHVIRAVPGPDPNTSAPPTPLDLINSATLLLIDRWELWRALGPGGTSPTVQSPYTRFAVGPCEPVGPSGGLAGSMLKLTLELA